MSDDLVIGAVFAGIPICALAIWHMTVSPRAWRGYLGLFVGLAVLGGIGLAARSVGGDSDRKPAARYTSETRASDLEDRIRVLERAVEDLSSRVSRLQSKVD